MVRSTTSPCASTATPPASTIMCAATTAPKSGFESATRLYPRHRSRRHRRELAPAARAAEARHRGGCRGEGRCLRPRHGPDRAAAVARDFARGRLMPVLNDLGQIAAWRKTGRGAPAMIHFDTGMSRLGLPRAEAERLADTPELLDRVGIVAYLSHLSSAG